MFEYVLCLYKIRFSLFPYLFQVTTQCDLSVCFVVVAQPFSLTINLNKARLSHDFVFLHQ